MSSGLPYFRWRLSKLARRLVRALARRAYRDTDRTLGRCILLAGSGRTGTTWLAELIASQIRGRVMFEPFYTRQVAAYEAFNYFQYMRPQQANPALEGYCRRVFSGDIRHPWIDRQVEFLRPRQRIVKAIRANLFLAWVQNTFPQVRIVLLIRHPCAVVCSRMRLGWADDDDLEPCLAQSELVEDFLHGRLDLLRSATTSEEKHAAIWSIHYLVALRQLDPRRCVVSFYEDLCRRPEDEMRRLFQALGEPLVRPVSDSMARPSITATRDSAIVRGEDPLTGWRGKLSAEQIARIRRVVRAFDLDHLYGDSTTPRGQPFAGRTSGPGESPGTTPGGDGDPRAGGRATG